MKTGLIGAMPEEVLLLKNQFENLKTDQIGSREFYTGTLCGQQVVMCLSGWGKVAVASAVTSMINLFGVDRLLFIGLAGSLDSRLEVGDIVVADSLVQHDVDLSQLQVGQVKSPFWVDFRFEVDRILKQKARKSVDLFVSNLKNKKYPHIENDYCPGVFTGTIGTGDQFVASTEGKRVIHSKYPDILCTEMEGAAMAQVAADYGIPLAVIRVISDKADEQANESFVKSLFGNISEISVEIAKLFFSEVSD